MSEFYELHKVDEATGNHAPILVGVTGDMRPSTLGREAVESLLELGKMHGARPVGVLEDGSVQIGHYLYVPVKQEQGE